MRYSSIECCSPEPREDRSKIKSAAHKGYDPTHGEDTGKQTIAGRDNTFADLRDQMDERRRQQARREGY